jgi:hypothetical protein
MDAYVALLLTHHVSITPPRWLVVQTALRQGWCARCALRTVGVTRPPLYRCPYATLLASTVAAVSSLRDATAGAGDEALALPADHATTPCVVCCGLLQDDAGVSVAYDQTATAQGSGGRSGAGREKKMDKRRARDAAVAAVAALAAGGGGGGAGGGGGGGVGSKRPRPAGGYEAAEDAPAEGEATRAAEDGDRGEDAAMATDAPEEEGDADTTPVTFPGLPWPLALVLSMSGAHGGAFPSDAAALQGCTQDLRCGVALHCSLPTAAAMREGAAL